MIWKMELECFTACRFDRHGFSFVYHGSVRRNNDMEGNKEIGVVINHDGLFIFYLYTCLFRLVLF